MCVYTYTYIYIYMHVVSGAAIKNAIQRGTLKNTID